MGIMAGIMAVSLGYTMYSGERAAHQQAAAQYTAENRAKAAADLADQANNQANAKKPNIAALIEANRRAAMAGGMSTMLTGPGGTQPLASPQTQPGGLKTPLGSSTLLGQ